MDPHVVALTGGIFLAALLFSTVGHGGASGYLAVMALAGLVPAEMRATALALNILVAGLGVLRFARVGALSWRLLLPFALASVPCAAWGGWVDADPHLWRLILALALLFASWRLWIHQERGDGLASSPPVLALALPLGGILGFVSGLIGIGGGIFLSPLLLLLRWGETRVVAGVSAGFILLNSISGLAATLAHGATLPSDFPGYAAAALLGGWLGSSLGSRRIPPRGLRLLLAGVLLLAATKLALT